MRQLHEPSKITGQDERLHVPTKAEILGVLLQEGSRAGLQLEWVLDRCDRQEGQG